MAAFDLNQRVFMIFQIGGQQVRPIGTAFGIDKRGVVLTAHHVVKNLPESELIVCRTGQPPILNIRVDRIVSHPEADVVALALRAEQAIEHFHIGKPDEGFSDFPLGTEVCSYGFPPLQKPVQPRLMKGHIQCNLQYNEKGYDYKAFEFSFPAFPGQSGSPVFDDYNRNNVVGIVTSSYSLATMDKGKKLPSAAGFWAIGASIAPLADWIRSIN